MTKDDRIGSRSQGAGSDAAPAGSLPPRPGSYSAEELAELERRERMSGWLLLFFAGAALATAALAFYLFSEDVEQNEEYVRADREQPSEVDDTPFNWGEAPSEPDAATTTEPEERGSAKPVAEMRPPPSPRMPDVAVEVPTPEPPTASSEPAAVTFAGPPAGSVDRETARALRSGKPQIWREKGQRGYVLVSDAVTYGTRECRQVSYTRFEQGRQATSSSAQWCRNEGSSRWRPDPRGPE